MIIYLIIAHSPDSLGNSTWSHWNESKKWNSPEDCLSVMIQICHSSERTSLVEITVYEPACSCTYSSYVLLVSRVFHFLYVQYSVEFVYVIAWFGVKFGINHTSNVPRMGLNYTRRSRVQFTILGTLRV